MSHVFFFEREWLDQINTFDDAFTRHIAALIRTAQARGEISTEKDSHALSLALLSNYLFVLTNYFLREKIKDPEQMVALLETLVEQTLH